MRRNGSIRGPANAATADAARGIWTMHELYRGVRDSSWPLAGVDPNFASVTSLLHFNNNTTDVKGHTWTTNGTGCAPSSLQAKFGGYSLLCPSSSGYLSTPSAAAFQLGQVNCTIEAWVYVSAYTGTRTIMSKWNGEWVFYITSTSLAIATGGGSFSATLSNTTANRWAHVAFTRSGTTGALFSDGVRLGTTTVNNWTDGSLTVMIGQNNSTNFFNGYIDDLRITKGVARYTGSTYTVPSAQHPDQ